MPKRKLSEEEVGLAPEIQKAMDEVSAFNKAVVNANNSPVNGPAKPFKKTVLLCMNEYDPEILERDPPTDGDIIVFFGGPGLGKSLACKRHALVEYDCVPKHCRSLSKHQNPDLATVCEWSHVLEVCCKEKSLHKLVWSMTTDSSDGNAYEKMADQCFVQNVKRGFHFGYILKWRVRVFLFNKSSARHCKRLRETKEAPTRLRFPSFSDEADVITKAIVARKRWMRVARFARLVGKAVLAFRELA